MGLEIEFKNDNKFKEFKRYIKIIILVYFNEW